MKRLIAVTASVFAFAALAASPALGGGGTAVKIKIADGPPAFHGKVKSDEKDCQAKRTVFLYRVKQGQDKTLGSDQTTNKGAWAIKEGDQFTLKSGVYYAQAPKLSLESGAMCKGDKSEKVAVD